MTEETSGAPQSGRVPSPRAERLARLMDDPFRPQPVQRSQRRRWEGDVPDMAKLFLGERKWDPNRRRYLPYWADQVEEANRRGSRGPRRG